MLEQVASHVARQATLHRQPGQAPSCVVPAAPTTLNKATGAGPRMLSTRSAYGPGHPLAVAHATTSDLPQTRCSYTRAACMASTPGAGCRYCPKKSAQLYTCNEGASMEDKLSSCSSYSLGRIRLDFLPSSGMALFSLLRRLRSSSGRGEGRGLCSRASMYRYHRYIVPSAPDMIAPAPGAWAVSPSRGISHGARRYQSYQTRASFYLLALARRLVGDRLRLRASDLPECQATATGVQSGPSPLLELKRVSALRN